MTDRFESLGREFDNRLSRQDGETLARRLHQNFESDADFWFYERVFPLMAAPNPFPLVLAPKLTEDELILCELKSRSEIACFQAIEAARFALSRGYIPPDASEWLLQWCLRLMFGDEIDDSVQQRVLLSRKDDALQRFELFRQRMWTVFFLRSRAYFYLDLYCPNLLLAAHATTASVFGDESARSLLKDRYLRRDTSLLGDIPFVKAGGGSFYILERKNGLVPFENGQKMALAVFRDEKLADRFRKKFKKPHFVSEMSFRALAQQLEGFEKDGIQTVFFDCDANDPTHPNAVWIGDMIRMIREAIANVDGTGIGKKYLEMRRREIQLSF